MARPTAQHPAQLAAVGLAVDRRPIPEAVPEAEERQQGPERRPNQLEPVARPEEPPEAVPVAVGLAPIVPVEPQPVRPVRAAAEPVAVPLEAVAEVAAERQRQLYPVRYH